MLASAWRPRLLLALAIVLLFFSVLCLGRLFDLCIGGAEWEVSPGRVRAMGFAGIGAMLSLVISAVCLGTGRRALRPVQAALFGGWYAIALLGFACIVHNGGFVDAFRFAHRVRFAAYGLPVVVLIDLALLTTSLYAVLRRRT